MIYKDFIPYELALELKQLEFNEPCLASYYHAGKKLDIPAGFKYINHGEYTVLAPTYSQAFRFFRENYDIHYSIDRERSQHDFEWGYNWSIYNYTGLCEEYVTSHPDAPAGEWIYETYEEAELACLKKLIEIVKGGNK